MSCIAFSITGSVVLENPSCGDEVPVVSLDAVSSFFCRKGTQDTWSVPRGDDGGHQVQNNGVPKQAVTRTTEAIELMPQVNPPPYPTHTHTYTQTQIHMEPVNMNNSNE